MGMIGQFFTRMGHIIQHITRVDYNFGGQTISLTSENSDDLEEMYTRLDDLTVEIEYIEENCNMYQQDGQWRIKGYAIEQKYETLCIEQEELLKSLERLESGRE